jgi:two-component system sensor histidine kinase BaeS
VSSIRGRLLAALLFAALVSIALTVVVATLTLRHNAGERQRATLERVGDVLAGPLASTLPGGGPGTVRVVRAYGLNGRPQLVRGRLRRLALATVPAKGETAGTLHAPRGTVSYATRDTAHGRIVFVSGARSRLIDSPPLGRTVLLAGLGATLVALVLSVLLARRLARPVRDVASAAKRLARGDRDVAVPVAGPDELADLARAFNAMASELHAARDAERQFLLSVSHELKTPLTVVRGYAEAIGDGAVPAATGAAVITEEAARLERLVADLLDLAKLEQARFAVAAEPIDLRAVADAVVQRHAVRAATLGIGLVSAGAQSAPARGDFDRTLQAASNLVENALRVLPPGGRVRVEALPGRLTVGDDGPGIAPTDLSRAFERFFLHDRYRSDRPVGSGLGLALVSELAQAMGGRATVTSAPGAGTAFMLELAV